MISRKFDERAVLGNFLFYYCTYEVYIFCRLKQLYQDVTKQIYSCSNQLELTWFWCFRNCTFPEDKEVCSNAHYLVTLYSKNVYETFDHDGVLGIWCTIFWLCTGKLNFGVDKSLNGYPLEVKGSLLFESLWCPVFQNACKHV